MSSPVVDLNPSQQAVANSKDKHVVVLAGAGTGKTAAIVHKVVGLIRSGIPRSKIMMITFTRKAAGEMQKRVSALLADRSKEDLGPAMLVGTYHALSSQIIRRDAKPFGLTSNNFTTLDEDDASSLMKSAFRECDIVSGDSLSPPALRAAISYALNKQIPVDKHLLEAYPGNADSALKLARCYTRLKRAANALDYDDLLTRWSQRLADDAAYATSLREQYPHVICDEFQDNNPLNYEILSRIDPHHLTVVGDVNQSIFGFRGASSSLVDRFLTDHPNARIIRLEDNYRSGQKILDLANYVVANVPRALVLKSAKGHACRVEQLPLPTPSAEASFVLDWIKKRIERKIKPAEVALLARSSRSLETLELALKLQKIPYRKYGGLSLGDAAEVKDFIAFIRVAFNKDDRVAMVRCLTLFPGVGEATAEQYVAEEDDADSLFKMERTLPKGAGNLKEWLAKLRSIPGLGAKGEYLLSVIFPLLQRNYPQDHADRMATLSNLVDTMKAASTSTADFLDAFSLEKSTATHHQDHEITVATIHASKGLEFEAVVVCGAGSGQMPHPRSIEPEAYEEERRLMYVAVTRAKKHLLITHPIDGVPKFPGQKLSPFLPPDFPYDESY